MRSNLRANTQEVAVAKSKLRFLGREYSLDNVVVETIPSDIMMCFRGQSYPLSRPVQNVSPQFELRKYRGVLYLKAV